jgi:hypothetical protein
MELREWTREKQARENGALANHRFIVGTERYSNSRGNEE